MLRDFKAFIHRFEPCLRCKNETVASPDLLHPLPIPNGVWYNISMDFVEGLPKSGGKDVIWVVVDRLSKYRHFVALAHPITAASSAQEFVDHIYKLHGAPTNIVSNRDPLFISKFWKEFVGHLGIEQSLSSAYHPQSDGQTEVLNRCLENYLRFFTWQHPQQSSCWLSLVEWWYNTTYHFAIGTTPYEVVYGQPPPVHLPYVPVDSALEAIDRSFTAREDMLRQLKENLRKVVHRMKQQADKSITKREFQEGDWVFLKLQAYKHQSVERRGSYKLALRFFGTYEIIAKVGKVAYTLKLPEGAKIHPTFHVPLLKRCPDSSVAPVHPPDSFSGTVVVKVPKAILDQRMIQRRGKVVTEVLIRWKNGNIDDDSWEYWSEVQNKFPEVAGLSHP